MLKQGANAVLSCTRLMLEQEATATIAFFTPLQLAWLLLSMRYCCYVRHDMFNALAKLDRLCLVLSVHRL